MRLLTSGVSLRLPEWNSRIKECLSNSNWYEIMSWYAAMRRSGVVLTDVTLFPSVVKASSKLSFRHGELMHGCSIKQGYESFTSVGNSTLDFYMKWGHTSSALAVFRSMSNRDSVSWNIVIHGHLDQGLSEDGLWFFEQGRVSGFEPNVSTLVLVTQAYCALRDMEGGRKLHGFVQKNGFWCAVSLQNSVLGMYADVNLGAARQLFDEMPVRDVISWSMMIGAYIKSEELLCALQMFKDMEVEPDGLTMVSVLKACGKLGEVSMGRCLHALVFSRGHYGEVFVANSVIDMYSRCNDPMSALRVFNEMPVKNIVSWNSLLSGLVHNGMHSEALSSANSMVQANIGIDEVTLVNFLQLCKHFSDPFLCKRVHGRIIRGRYELNTLVVSSLIDAYAKCNLIELAWRMFSIIDKKDTVAWATMIGGFAHCGMPDEAVTVFRKMAEAAEGINIVVILNLVEACKVSAELGNAEWVHCIAVRNGFAAETSVATAIVDLYSKCGAVEKARTTFDQISEKNIMSWSTMVSAYGMNGRAADALALVTEMKRQGVQPNAVTALSVLAACSHGGLISAGLSFFKEMVEDLEIQPSLEHYACLIDMLSRSGKLNNAVELIKIMPEHLKTGASLWGALLSACTRYKKAEIGEGAASRVIELEPSGSSGYLLASHLHATAGSWANVAKTRRLVKERGVHVVAGYSLVHVDGEAFKFVAGDKSVPQATESCYVVELLHKCMQTEDKYDEVIGL